HPLLNPNVTFEAFAAQWLWDNAGEGTWRRGTLETYKYRVGCELCPFTIDGTRLGDFRVRDIERSHVEVAIRGLRSREGYSRATPRDCFRLLRTILDRAVSTGLLASHPVDAELRRQLRPTTAKKAGDEGSSVKAFTTEQAQRFLAVTAKHSRLHALYQTGF